MGCRDMEKCDAAAKDIRGKTLNPHVYACHLDLASMKSVREFAEKINRGDGNQATSLFLSFFFTQKKENNNKHIAFYCRGESGGCTDKQCGGHEVSSMEDRGRL